MTNRHSIDLGTLQTTLQNARRQHSTNSKALTKAQDAAARSKKTLDDAHAALDAASRNILANG
jgi:hypothetical protein